ncbi:hypothetical protein D6856_00030 [Butyrivibrio sp. XB500-5]|uniref:hypothetical protein n=1 Tax=Butyrivibrio sp. XB500-5 TaxID=2364880 RepID=UPI000EAA65B0|nr:hypothetical protein [Butyrivibrio sp. XB500-5]RKM62553.1 hypothetical protein D6856_00030 [Butyrivibrio sp. XB500-5]
MNNIINEDDFKYYMQDIERYYFGARYNYNELLQNELVPFKFKTVITKYIKDDIDLSNTLESHIYYLTRETYDYKVLKQLRCRVRTSIYKNPDKKDKGFKEKIYKIEEIAKISTEDKEKLGMIVRELIISKLGLWSFQV